MRSQRRILLVAGVRPPSPARCWAPATASVRYRRIWSGDLSSESSATHSPATHSRSRRSRPLRLGITVARTCRGGIATRVSDRAERAPLRHVKRPAGTCTCPCLSELLASTVWALR